MWDRSKIFLRRAGTVILGISILMWFLQTYPKDSAREQQYAAKRTDIAAAVQAGTLTAATQTELLAALDKEELGAQLRHSFAGRIGHAIEPLIAPLGFDWKIGIGIVASFAAREVFVSTMSTVYNSGEDAEAADLAKTLQAQTRADGTPLYTLVTGLTLMVFYVFALQCVSTVAVVRRETNSWKWPLFQWFYMGTLAWGLAFITKLVSSWLTA
jgi:ferrous iron transport protein B